jgi:hypothetical protein
MVKPAFNWGSVAWLSMDAGVSRSAQNWSSMASARCYLLRPERQFVNEIGVSKTTLILEATLTESCAPVRFRWRDSGGFLTLVDVSAGCRTKTEPEVDGSEGHIY